MKKILLHLMFWVGGLASVHAQQLPNYGFDNWKNSCGTTESLAGDGTGMRQRPGVEPSEWNGSSVNQKVSIVTKKQELVYNESNAVKLVNTFVGMKLFGKEIGSVAPGFITLGTPWVCAVTTVSECNGGTYGGVNFSYKPDAITGKYKRTDATGEESHIIAYLWNGTFTSKVGKVSSPSVSKDDVEYAILGKSTATASGTLVASCDYTFTATTNSDWETITVPLNYASTADPTMMNVIISGGNYWDRSSLVGGTTLIADDVRFVYYSTLSSLSYCGVSLQVPEAEETLDMSSMPYDEKLLDYTINGQSATSVTSYDEESAVLTITVSNVDDDIDGQSSHTYYIQFAKPHVHELMFTAEGASLFASCACGDAFGSMTLVLPSDLVYDGAAKTVSVEGAVEGVETPAVVYSCGDAPVNVGTYTASITLGGATATVEYTIEAKDISGAVAGEFAAMTYTGEAQIPVAVVTLEGFGEVTGSWSEVLNVGDKSVFTATGNFAGSLEAEVAMQAKDITGAVVGEFAAMTYTGEAQTPVVVVTLEGFGEVTGSWSEVLNVGDKSVFTATGNFAGSLEAEVAMQAKELEESDVVLESDTVEFTGEAIVPVVTVNSGDALLVEGTDYVVAYSDNVDAGVATVTVTAMGNYSGTVVLNFAIVYPTSIAPVQSQATVVYYDLCGRRAEQPVKGKIYIANGKKVIY